jgi:hypothetical protein
MKLLPALPVAALWFAVVAANPPPTPTPTPPPTSPSPILTPSINLNPPAGPAGTQVTITGTQLPPNQTFSVIWDNNGSRVLGSGKADGSGNFTTKVAVPDDKLGNHGICLTQPANVCAAFTVQPKPTPSPSPTPTPTPKPSPSPSPSPTPTPIPPVSNQTAQVNGLTLLFQPPFVFFPLLVALALVVAFGVWVRTLFRPKEPELEASVSHHRVRSAGYPPPGQEPEQPDEIELPPALDFLPPAKLPEPELPAPPPTPDPPAPPYQPPPRPTGSDEPPDLPEPAE